MDALGAYEMTQTFNPDSFLEVNTLALANEWGIKPGDIIVKVAAFTGLKKDVAVGTKRFPLSQNKKLIHCEATFAVYYNRQRINYAYQHPELLDLVVFLWGEMGLALRSYLFMENVIDESDLLPHEPFKIHFGQEVTDSMLKVLTESFIQENWSPERMREEIDALFISAYICRLVALYHRTNQEVTFSEIARIIRQTKRSTWRTTLPILGN